jgi:thiol-disulfide isomerase/thioredoxin
MLGIMLLVVPASWLVKAHPSSAQTNPDEAILRQAPIALANEGPMPSLDGIVAWLNSKPLTRKDLKGKVVLIDFWTYSCINCLRTIPYVEAWSRRYASDGLVVIGVHTPEFGFEKDRANIQNAIKKLGITYAVAVDSDQAVWRAFQNQYWPAHYFIDAFGTIRYHHFGEGEYGKSEEVIQQLLKEKNSSAAAGGLVQVTGTGSQAPPDLADVQSPETYIGYERKQNFVSSEKIKHNAAATYTAPVQMKLNEWGLDGKWIVSKEYAALSSAPGKIVFRFHARDIHLVLGPGKNENPVRFRVLVDGAPPQEDHGADTDPDGNGSVSEYRLYQLIRQKGKIVDRTFQIEFLDSGIQAFAFTFG